MSIISWGRHQRFAFSSGGALEGWTAPTIPAIYAVTYQRDPHNKPKSHTVLFFGESENLSSQSHSIRAEMSALWLREGGSSGDLFIFVHPMQGSTMLDRSRVLERLVLEYQPEGNRASY